MDQSTLLGPVSTITFLVVIGLLALVYLLTAYVFIRYGQKKTFTLVVSMVFAGLLFLGALNAFFHLQKLF